MQGNLVDRPSKHAYTDIYDGVVQREVTRHDGTIYLIQQVESREAPEHVNWKTSYRLKCSALVGVVRLSSSRESLAPHYKVNRAEIVPVGTERNADSMDHLNRSNGKMALRFLTTADIKALSKIDNSDENSSAIGDRIVIIDLQVFLHEVIPVSSALTDE